MKTKMAVRTKMAMKKRILGILAVAALLFLCAAPALADGGPAISVGTVAGAAGDEVLVPITLSNNPGIAGFRFRLYFDNTRLLPVDLAQGVALNIGSITTNLDAGGDLSALSFVSVSWANASNFTGNGAIYTVRFRIKEGAAGGEAPLTLTYSLGDVTNQTYDDVDLLIENGKVTVQKLPQEAPAAFELLVESADGATYIVTIPPLAGAEYSFDGIAYSAENSKVGCLPGETVTGYMRLAESGSFDASAATSASADLPLFKVEKPTAVPNGGTFADSVSVALACATSGADIYYTVDGSDPAASGILYSAPFALTDSATVKAVATKAGMSGSDALTAIFTKQASGGEQADKSALSSLAKNAQAMDARAFDTASREVFEPALGAAQATLANGSATQAEVDAAKARLDSAMRGLKATDAMGDEYGALARLLRQAALLNENDYTERSWENLEDAVAEAWILVAAHLDDIADEGGDGQYGPLADTTLDALLMLIKVQECIDDLEPAGGQEGPSERNRISGGIYAKSDVIEIFEEYAEPGDGVDAGFVLSGNGISKVGMVEVVISYPETAAGFVLSLPSNLAEAGVELDCDYETETALQIPNYIAVRAYVRAPSGGTLTLADGAPLLNATLSLGATENATAQLALTRLNFTYYDDGYMEGKAGIDADTAISSPYARTLVRVASRFDVNRDGAVTLADADAVRYYLGAAKTGDAWESDILARCDLAANGVIEIDDLTQVLAKYELLQR